MRGLGEPALLVLLVTPNGEREGGCRAKGWSRLAFWTRLTAGKFGGGTFYAAESLDRVTTFEG
jgi:hypothetical protein